jgi:hypothetical protein
MFSRSFPSILLVVGTFASLQALQCEAKVGETCHLQYYHKGVSGPEPENMNECHPWQKNACCKNATVGSAEQIRKAYGKNWEWDRCETKSKYPKMSAACYRYFVQEACFYECEPAAGLFRKYAPDEIHDPNMHHSKFNPSDDTHNKWEMHRMPIRADYCDAWYRACRNDYFTAAGNGSFWAGINTTAPEFPQCDKMGKIFTGGKQLCEVMWGGSFKYEEDLDMGYTMWFFTQDNPNDITTARRKAKKEGKAFNPPGCSNLDSNANGPASTTQLSWLTLTAIPIFSAAAWYETR